MIVSHRHKLVFTHIPKNAGTSIKSWLRQHVKDAQEIPGVDKHHTPHHLTDTVYGTDYKLFAVVRNPYDRLLSLYNFHVERYEAYTRPKSKLNHKSLYHDKLAELRKGFTNWITEPYPIADKQAKWYDYRWCPQAMWCTPDTHILKFETLAQDFQWVQELVGVQAPLETLNTTSTDNDHTTSANRVLLAPHRPLVQSHLMVDFQRFGYAPDFNRSGKIGG